MKYVKLFLLVAVALFAVNSAAYAEPAAHQERITLEFHASKYFSIDKKVVRVFVGSGDIIKVRQPGTSSNEFVITAQASKGSTTLFVWTADGERYEYLVSVVDEEIGQAEIIEQAINLPNVHVKKVGDRILLTGKVKNQYQTARLYVADDGNNNLSVGSNVDMQLQTQEATSAGSITIDTSKLVSTGKIIDLLEMESPIQIRLEAQVIEINSDNAKELGVQYGVNRTGGVFYFGEDYKRTKTYTPTYFDPSTGMITSGNSYTARNTPLRENPLRWLEENFAPINGQINALVTKGKAKVLSRPNITTMSGESAKIRIGGEIPYTTTDDDGSKTTEFKDYGIILQFKPILDAQGRITMAVHTEVSSIGGTTPDGEQYTLNTRSADSVVNVISGSTMVVGGLMDSSETKNINKIPLLGDIPILGEFFKYNSKSRDKRELMVVVTPYIVGDYENTHAAMSDEMRDYYHAGQRDKNSMNDVDLNALPPPFTEEDKKSKKDKKSKAKKSKSSKVVIEEAKDDTKNTDAKTTNSNGDPNVEVFGEDY